MHRKGKPDTAAIEEARKVFLEAYVVLIPEALTHLAERAWPLYDCGPKEQRQAEKLRRREPFGELAAVFGITSKAGRDIFIHGREAFDLTYNSADEGREVEPLEESWAYVSGDRPALADALSQWAADFRLTLGGRPAVWVLEAAVSTLCSWGGGIRRLRWHHPEVFHEEYPAGDPGFRSVQTGELDSVIFRFLEPWDRPGGEKLADYSRRSKQSLSEHIQQMKEWTDRARVEEWLYFEALARWQADHDLAAIRAWLAANELNVGSPGDLSAISKGLTKAAEFIGIDRRPAR
jgi:hypothetical protein